MKFIIFVIDNAQNSGSEAEMFEIDKFNHQLKSNNQWVYACGIVAPEHAVLIDFRAEKKYIESASIMNSDEFISGFWIIEATDMQEAKILASKGSHACNRRVELHAEL